MSGPLSVLPRNAHELALAHALATREPRGGPQFPDTLHLILLAATEQAALLRRGFDLLAARGGKGAQGFLLLS